MSKVLVVPDPHLKTSVIEKGLELADKLNCDTVVILGDYFDDWDAPLSKYVEMRDYLKNLLKHRPNVFPLIGNHELSYIGWPCSGYKAEAVHIVKPLIEDDYRFLLHIDIDGVLYTHAGVTRSWIRDNKIIQENTVRYHMGKVNGAAITSEHLERLEKFDLYAQAGPARGGRMCPSPLWADLDELVVDPLGKFTQVVGHTPVNQIEKLGNCWFTDVYSNGNVSDEYLVVNEGIPEIVHYNELILGEY